MWQKLYDELRDLGFVVIAVAMDSRGNEAARPWIEQAKPTYPCLIDRDHLVARLYAMVNVPQAVWIDESGRVVRPTETAATSDAFRAMDRTSFTLPDDARAALSHVRRTYLEAVRDWVRRGGASAAVPSEAERRRRAPVVDERIALASAHFRLGQFLVAHGQREEGLATLRRATELHPESWNFWRQSADLDRVGTSGGPGFWARVDALGSGRYYAPIDLPGLDPDHR